LYNIPQAVFDDALRENEVESENEEIEKEMEIELEDNGEEFIPADTDDESENEVIIDDIISKKNRYIFLFFLRKVIVDSLKKWILTAVLSLQENQTLKFV
jgi:hypothetical protein